MNVEYGYVTPHRHTNNTNADLEPCYVCYVLHLMRDYPGSILIPCPRKDIKLSSWKCVVAEMAAPSWKFIAPKVLTHAHVHAH